jgi:tetratricopeptide (TPR) repeat protein
MRGHASEGRRWIARVLERAPSHATAARAKALDGAGYLAGEQGDVEAVPLLESALTCAREVGSQAAVAIAATHLSAHLPVEEAAEALLLGEEAVSLAREAGDHWVLAVALNNLGEVARELGDAERATALYEESYRLRRELGDASRIALSLLNLGEMAFSAGDTERARLLLSEALALARGIGDKRHICFALGDLGWVALGEGRHQESDGLFRESLVLSRELGQKRASVHLLHGLAGAAAAAGNAVRAARLEGAAEQLESVVGRLQTPPDADAHVPHLAALRARCGDAVWDDARKDGSLMILDEAIEYALEGA